MFSNEVRLDRQADADMPWEFQNKGVTLKMMIRIDIFIFALLMLACCSLNRYIGPDQWINTIQCYEHILVSITCAAVRM